MIMNENQNTEWKESWRDEYLKWICGFANATGGKIYIGMNDNGKVVGVADADKLLEDIPNKVRDVLGIIVDVNLLEENGLKYIEIDVPPYSNPINYKGQYHYRSGSTKQELKGAALNRFILQRTGRHWDEFPIEWAGIEELSPGDRAADQCQLVTLFGEQSTKFDGFRPYFEIQWAPSRVRRFSALPAYRYPTCTRG